MHFVHISLGFRRAKRQGLIDGNGATLARKELVESRERGGCALLRFLSPLPPLRLVAVCVCVCACTRVYISKPVVTAPPSPPPSHYLSHASAPIFIGEVIHEASSSSLSPTPPPPYLPHNRRALSRGLGGGGGGYSIHVPR